MERMRERVFNEADLSKDGLISYEEFLEQTNNQILFIKTTDKYIWYKYSYFIYIENQFYCTIYQLFYYLIIYRWKIIIARVKAFDLIGGDHNISGQLIRSRRQSV